jgi:hypothetical protein
MRELRDLTLNRLNHVFREASFQYQHARNTDYNAKVRFLRVMLDAMAQFTEFAKASKSQFKTDEIKLTWLTDKEDKKAATD